MTTTKTIVALFAVAAALFALQFIPSGMADCQKEHSADVCVLALGESP